MLNISNISVFFYWSWPPLTHSCQHTWYYKVNLTLQGALQVGRNLTIWSSDSPLCGNTNSVFLEGEERTERDHLIHATGERRLKLMTWNSKPMTGGELSTSVQCIIACPPAAWDYTSMTKWWIRFMVTWSGPNYKESNLKPTEGFCMLNLNRELAPPERVLKVLETLGTTGKNLFLTGTSL